jgi:hypothetical protein
MELIHPVLYVDLVHKITEEENWNDILSAFEASNLADIFSIKGENFI